MLSAVQLRLAAAIVVGVVLILLLTSNQRPSRANEATLLLSSTQSGVTRLDPINTPVTSLAFSLIYDRLLVQAADQSFHPHLATDWTVSADGMMLEFGLREGVRFHDGSPFNANTIVNWLPLFKGSANAYLVAAIRSVEVVHEHRVRLRLHYPDANLLYNFSREAMGIPNPASYRSSNQGPQLAIGTGPYQLEQFVPGSHYQLRRNPDYHWGSALSRNPGAAHIERLTLREPGSIENALVELKLGTIDLIDNLPATLDGRVRTLEHIDFRTLPGFTLFYMPINTSIAPFTDIRVRKAVSLAVNQQQLVDQIAAGRGIPARNLLLSSLPEAQLASQYNTHFDPVQAEKLLEAAGWQRSDQGPRQREGTLLKVRLWSRGDSSYSLLAALVARQLEAVGFEVEVQTIDKSVIRNQYHQNQHHLAIRSYGWNNADILDWFFSAERLGYPNVSMWVDTGAERLRKAAMTGARNAEERVHRFRNYHRYIMSQHVSVPLYEPILTLAYNRTYLHLPRQLHSSKLDAAVLLDAWITGYKDH